MPVLDVASVKTDAEAFARRILPNYVDGEFREPRDAIGIHAVRNPWDGSDLAVFGVSGYADVDDAVAAARTAQRKLSAVSPAERAGLVHALAGVVRSHAPELAAMETLNAGLPFRRALMDYLSLCWGILDDVADWLQAGPNGRGGASRIDAHRPIGVAAAVASCDSPLLATCRDLAGGLGSGNALLLTVDEATPLSVLRLLDLCMRECAWPAPNAVQFLYGDHRTATILGDHSGIAHVSYRGGAELARKLVRGAALSNLKTVALDLDGGSVGIVRHDAMDLEAAASVIVRAVAAHQKELTPVPRVLCVAEAVYEDFVAAVVAEMERLGTGDPFADETDIGPSPSEAHMWRVLDGMEEAEMGRAERMCGIGRSHARPARGYFVQPTAYGRVRLESAVANSDLVGPLLCVAPFAEESSVLQHFQPRHCAIWSADIERARHMADGWNATTVWLNPNGKRAFAVPEPASDLLARFATRRYTREGSDA